MQTVGQKSYRTINLTVGWVSFLIAAVVYLLTIEPTASFWDCGEFIASGFKLEVGHPPGAPIFMLLMRFFTMLAPGKELIPIFANSMSALASAFTILFLFWSITHLARKIFDINNNEFTLTQVILIMGSGLVGALAYTFSDTFWFSAVEGEVYATSSLFTAFVFWAILKWENVANEPHANRWLILIAYLMGLSIGVHLLNLLAIPAIVMVYYFKKYEVTTWGIVKALALSVILLGTMMYGIIQGVIVLASKFELLFVNGFGLPYKSGVFFYIAALIALITWGIIYSHKKSKPILNTILLGFTVILIGYSSFALIVIRSSAKPPMNQNNPDNMFSLLYYLNREQYGDRPLVTGQTFNAPMVERKNGSPQYIQKDGKYVVATHKTEFKYDDRFTTVFPRMYSSEPNHVRAYKEWSNFTGRPIRVNNYSGESEVLHVPTFGENLRFFFSYQLGHMYWRYFMWNFAGRQNDIQGHGEILKGNWISGIPFIDTTRLGPQDELPSTYKNKAHNRYFMLPFILGLAGLFFQLYRNKKDFWVVMLLFILTGIAIVVYLNQTPYQPRERDYAYAGSFYAFSIWIGLGVLALYQVVRKAFDNPVGATITTAVCLVFVPGIMAAENWDDHDRSGNFIANDFAYNALNTCEPNSILFSYGDNDTFPLWYAQEVEGVRTDVRVSNLSYLRADWYIDQMKRKAYESEPIPVSMTNEKYVTGTRDLVLAVDRINRHINVKQAIDFVLSDDAATKVNSPIDMNEKLDFFPSKSLMLPVDKELIEKKGVVSSEKMSSVVDTMKWRLSSNYLLKDGLFLMDLMANNNWERPMYFVITVSSDTYQNLDKFFQVEGLTYRIVPIEARRVSGRYGNVESKIMYNNLMNVYRWRSIADPNVYINENSARIISNYRNIFGRLALQLIEENKMDKAIEVVDKCMEVIPPENVPFNFFALTLIESYYRAGAIDKGVEYSKQYMTQCAEELDYFLRLPDSYVSNIRNETELSLYILQELYSMAKTYEKGEHKAELEELFNTIGGKM
ncbi:MAG TPA: DUF2723 domain-containing protein [Tenuifilaceae bacterium]|nr:DUF2723 domain-containing protein [Tenuifilaceae bacterium]HPE19196.1 DUF2723 domain-containing protein [Tenuifilaceae bacterium]HPJ45743.1 DUF2723 domain-containing protein [Tenuifilaceae bacterium]HPQ33696.1 DUF2723 domain-containing protein [Tenuifilaceae bacterium]